MSAPDPEGVSLLSRIIQSGAAILAPVGGLWLWIDSRFAKKHTVNNQLQEIKNEQGIHRGYFKDVFEKLEAHQRRDEEMFREVLGKMGDNHVELLKALGGKADR